MKLIILFQGRSVFDSAVHSCATTECPQSFHVGVVTVLGHHGLHLSLNSVQ